MMGKMVSLPVCKIGVERQCRFESYHIHHMSPTKLKGNIALGRAIAYYTAKGCIVSLPLNDSQEYDLIVDDGELLWKVDVKYTSIKTKDGTYKLGLRTTGGNQSFHTSKHFDSTKVDFIFVLCDDGTMYGIPSIELPKSEVTLGVKYKNFKLGVSTHETSARL